MLSVLLSLFAITFCLGQETYEDYSVLRLYDMTEKTVSSLIEDDVDIWATNKKEGWADVMVHRDQLSKYTDLYSYKLVLDNVQEEVNRSLAENEQARAASEGKFAFDFFPSLAQVNTWLTQTANQHPNYARVFTIGNSVGGNPIRGLHLNSGNTNAPIFFIHCGIHAREWITVTTCAYIVNELLSSDTNLLQYFNFHIIPVLNVDGYQYTHTTSRLWRKNRQTNSGSTCVGTDLNRNYRQGWGGGGSSGDPCSDTYRGASPFSGPEINHERAYLTGKNTAVYVDIHAYGGMFMCPWGANAQYPPDYNEMDRLMVHATNAIYDVNGVSYAYGTVYHTIYQASGGSNDWCYGEEGVVPAYAIEARGTNFTPPVSQIVPIGSEIHAGMKALANQVLRQQ